MRVEMNGGRVGVATRNADCSAVLTSLNFQVRHRSAGTQIFIVDLQMEKLSWEKKFPSWIYLLVSGSLPHILLLFSHRKERTKCACPHWDLHRSTDHCCPDSWLPRPCWPSLSSREERSPETQSCHAGVGDGGVGGDGGGVGGSGGSGCDVNGDCVCVWDVGTWSIRHRR